MSSNKSKDTSAEVAYQTPSQTNDSTETFPSEQCHNELTTTMTRYLDEHDQYLSTLGSGESNARDHASKLAEEICDLDHDIGNADENADEEKPEAARAAAKEELQRLKKQWDKENAEDGVREDND